MTPKIWPHQVILVTAFLSTVIAYTFFSQYDLWSAMWHYRLMAVGYCLFILAAHRMSDNIHTRLIINIIQGAAVQNLWDETVGDPITQIWWKEYAVFTIWTTFSIVLYLRRKKKEKWRMKPTS